MLTSAVAGAWKFYDWTNFVSHKPCKENRPSAFAKATSFREPSIMVTYTYCERKLTWTILSVVQKYSKNKHTPAIAWANKVLPQPGGPCKRNPLGGVTPRVWNTSGCFMWTNSLQTCSTVSSQPPRSENLTEDCAGSKPKEVNTKVYWTQNVRQNNKWSGLW